MIEDELDQRVLDAMKDENQGSPYHRIHVVAERALFGRFEVALRIYEVKK